MTRKTIVHVNRQHIAQNVRDGGERPVLTAKDYRQNRKGQSAEIKVDGKIVGRFRSEWAGDGQLKCGARVWLEVYEGDGVEIEVRS